MSTAVIPRKQWVNIHLDGAGEAVRFLRLAETERKKAEFFAVKRATQGARTDVTNILRKEMGLNLKLKDLRKRLDVVRPTKAKPVGKIRIKGAAIPLFAFAGRPTKPGLKFLKSGARVPRVGASALIFKGAGRQTLAGSFVIRTKKGGIGIWRRQGKERKPIRQLWGPKPEALLAEGQHLEDLRERVALRLDKAMDHELKRALDRAKKKAGAR